MTRREQLQEQYEDALFALLMDDLMWQKGEQLLEENERLKNDPDAEVPEDVMKRCRKVINQEFARKTASKVGRTSWNVFKRVAIAACISVLLFTAAFATSETVRVNTLNLLIEVCDRNTDYRFRPEANAAGHSGGYSGEYSGYDLAWLPEGLTMTDQSNNPGSVRTAYKGPHEEDLRIRLFTLGEAGVLSVNTEDAVVEDITVNGWEGYLITTDHFQAVFPFPETTQFLIVNFFTGESLPEKEVFLRILEGISLY